MTKTISQEIVNQLQEQFLGKIIELTDSKGQKWAGICEFIGTNPFIPSWGLQVTIGRTPITNVRINDIHLIK